MTKYLIPMLVTRFGHLQAALERGLLPDDETLKQLALDPELPIGGRDIHSLAWPEEPLRYVLISESPPAPSRATTWIGSSDMHKWT